MIGVGINMGIGVGGGSVSQPSYLPTLVDSNNAACMRAATFTSALADSKLATFSAWLSFQDTNGSSAEPIFQVGPTSSQHHLYLSRRTDGGLSARWGSYYDADIETYLSQDGGAAVEMAVPISTGYLHHLFVTLDCDSGLEVYVDGELVGSGVASFPGEAMDLSTATAFGLFSTSGGITAANRPDVHACDVMFFAGHKGDVDDFYNGGTPPNPGADGSGVDGTTPQFFCGGAMTAAQWQAATLQSLGTGTMTHPGTFIAGPAYVPPVTVTLVPSAVRRWSVHYGAGPVFDTSAITTGGTSESVYLDWDGATSPASGGAYGTRFIILRFVLPDAAIIHAANLQASLSSLTGDSRLTFFWQWEPDNVTYPTAGSDTPYSTEHYTDDDEHDPTSGVNNFDLKFSLSQFIRGYNPFATPISDPTRYDHGECVLWISVDEYPLEGSAVLALLGSANPPALTVTYTPT